MNFAKSFKIGVILSIVFKATYLVSAEFTGPVDPCSKYLVQGKLSVENNNALLELFPGTPFSIPYSLVGIDSIEDKNAHSGEYVEVEVKLYTGLGQTLMALGPLKRIQGKQLSRIPASGANLTEAEKVQLKSSVKKLNINVCREESNPKVREGRH